MVPSTNVPSSSYLEARLRSLSAAALTETGLGIRLNFMDSVSRCRVKNEMGKNEMIIFNSFCQVSLLSELF